MDYTWDGIKGGGTSPYEKGKYMSILRNHRYIFTIKEVKGPGFATLNEAVTSPDNFTNHNIVVVPIVIDAFTDITFNESGHFLAVTRTAMTLQGKHDATSTQNMTMSLPLSDFMRVPVRTARHTQKLHRTPRKNSCIGGGGSLSA